MIFNQPNEVMAKAVGSMQLDFGGREAFDSAENGRQLKMQRM